MRSKLSYALAILIVLSVTYYSCKDNSVSTTTSSTTLYTRLGGYQGIDTVTAVFINNVVADTSINAFFSGVVHDTSGARYRLLRQNLVQLICVSSGGPCVYLGKDMRTAHQGMNLTVNNFNSLVHDLVTAMTTLGVSQQNQNDLLAILGPLCHDVVANGNGTGCP